MKTLSCSLVVGLISVYLLASNAANSTACSRDMSRKVRNFLDSNFYNKIDNYVYPESCPLNPVKDVYRNQEKLKKMYNQEWKVSMKLLL